LTILVFNFQGKTVQGTKKVYIR